MDEVGENGSVGDVGEIGEAGIEPVSVMIFCRASVTPFAGTGAVSPPSGVTGCDQKAFAASEFASNSSGGSLSFSISDLRLRGTNLNFLLRGKQEIRTRRRSQRWHP